MADFDGESSEESDVECEYDREKRIAHGCNLCYHSAIAKFDDEFLCKKCILVELGEIPKKLVYAVSTEQGRRSRVAEKKVCQPIEIEFQPDSWACPGCDIDYTPSRECSAPGCNKDDGDLGGPSCDLCNRWYCGYHKSYLFYGVCGGCRSRY
jgi:hypothetical protein